MVTDEMVDEWYHEQSAERQSVILQRAIKRYEDETGYTYDPGGDLEDFVPFFLEVEREMFLTDVLRTLASKGFVDVEVQEDGDLGHSLNNKGIAAYLATVD